jgi:hypothetical protein
MVTDREVLAALAELERRSRTRQAEPDTDADTDADTDCVCGKPGTRLQASGAYWLCESCEEQARAELGEATGNGRGSDSARTITGNDTDGDAIDLSSATTEAEPDYTGHAWDEWLTDRCENQGCFARKGRPSAMVSCAVPEDIARRLDPDEITSDDADGSEPEDSDGDANTDADTDADGYDSAPWTFDEFKRACPATRCLHKYSSQDRANLAASHRLTPGQRASMGEYFYVHPLQPSIAFPTRKRALTAAWRAYQDCDGDADTAADASRWAAHPDRRRLARVICDDPDTGIHQYDAPEDEDCDDDLDADGDGYADDGDDTGNDCDGVTS